MTEQRFDHIPDNAPRQRCPACHAQLALVHNPATNRLIHVHLTTRLTHHPVIAHQLELFPTTEAPY